MMGPSPKDMQALAASASKDVAFIMGFAKAATKLRDAQRVNVGCTLTADEAAAMVDGLRLLRQGLAVPEGGE